MSVGYITPAEMMSLFPSPMPSFHPLVPTHYQTIYELTSFINQTTGQTILQHSFLPRLRNILLFAAGIFLFVALAAAY